MAAKNERNVDYDSPWKEVLELPPDLEDKLAQAINEFEEVKKTRYITSVERRGIQQGIQQGMQQGLMEAITLDLKLKFGKEGVQEASYIRKVKNLETLRSILNSIKTVRTLDELHQIYFSQSDDNE